MSQRNPNDSVEISSKELLANPTSDAIVERPVEISSADLLAPPKQKQKDITLGGKQLNSNVQSVETERFKRSPLDRGYRFGFSLDEHRANNQSALDQFGNFVAQGLIDGVLGQTVGAVGAIGGIAEAIYDKAVGNPSTDFNNVMLEWSRDLRDLAQENFPIYTKNPEETFAVSDFGWWMKGGVSVFSTVGLLVPGFAAGKLAGKGTQMLSKVLKLSDKTTDVLTSLSSITGAALVQRNAEGFMESGQLAATTREVLMQEWQDEENWNKALQSSAAKELDKLGEVITKETLSNYVAAKAGWRAYSINSANIVFDMIQVAPLFKTTSKVLKPNKLPKAVTGNKFTRPVKKAFNTFGTTILRQSTEGIEESVNYIGSEEGGFYGNSILNKAEDINFSTRMGDYLSDGHFWESAFWGLGGGIAFEGATKGIRALTKKEKEEQKLNYVQNYTIDKLNQRKNYIDNIAKVLKGYENNIGYTTDKEGNEIEVDLSTVPSEIKELNFNTTKLASSLQLGIVQAELNSVDNAIGQLDDGTFDEIFEDIGIENKEDIQKEKQNIKEGIKKGEELYNKAIKLVDRVDTKDTKVKQQILQKLIPNLVSKELNNYQTKEFKNISDTLKSDSEVYNQTIEENLNAAIAFEKAAVDRTLNSIEEFKEGIRGSLVELETSIGNITKSLQYKQKELNKLFEDSEDKPYNIPKGNQEFNDIIDAESAYLFHDLLQKELAQDTIKLSSDSYVPVAEKELENYEKDKADKELNQVKEQLALVNTKAEASTTEINSALTELREYKKIHQNYEAASKLIEDKIQELERVKKIRTVNKEDVSTTQDQYEKGVLAEATEFDDAIPEATGNNILDDDFEEEASPEIIEEEQETTEQLEEENPEIIPDVIGEVLEEDNNIQSNIVNSTIQKEPINNDTKEKENIVSITRQNVGSTNVVLAVKESELATDKNLNDRGNKTISNQDSIYDILAGKYKVGDTVSIRPVLDDGNQTSAADITLQILGRDNKVLAYVNKLSSKRAFIEREKARVKEQEGGPTNDDKVYIGKLEEEYKALENLRLHIFSTASSFALSPFKTSIIKLNSGSIVNIENQQGLNEAFGNDFVLYKVAANNSQVLEPINRPDLEEHVRNADEFSVLNNIDSVYTRGIFSTVVKAPNGQNFPVPLQTSTLTQPFVDKVYEGLYYITNEITSNRLKANDEIITTAKDVLNQITYVGKGNIEVYDTNIKITTIKDKESGKQKAVKLFFNKVNANGTPSLVLQEELINPETKKFEIVSTIRNSIAIEERLKNYISELLFNPTVVNINTSKKYTNPLNRNFDGTKVEGTQDLDSYKDFIIQNNILTTNVGTVKDQQGNIVSNFAVKGKSNLVLGIDTTISQERKKGVESKSQKIVKDSSSITSKIFSPFTSFKELSKSLKLSNQFNYLFDYADSKGIKITNKSKVEGVAGINIKTKNISFNKDILALKESEGKGIEYIEEVLAHEIVHGFILNEVVDTKRLDNELLQFINSVKFNLASASPRVKSLYKYIENSSPQEIVSIAYTNKEFASWLQTIPSNIEPNNSNKNLLTNFIDYIKSLIKEVIGVSKLDELNTIINTNLYSRQSKIDFTSIDDSDATSAFEDDLEGLLGFPNIEDLYRELQYLEELSINYEDIAEVKVINSIPKLNKESVEKETGLKVGINKDINIVWIDSTSKTSISKAAENIYQSLFYESNELSEQEVKDIIIDTLSSTKTVALNQYKNTNKIKQLRDQINEFESNYITNKEIKDSVEVLVAFFTRVSQNEKYKDFNESDYKAEFKKLLIGVAKKPDYPFKDNMSKVINNYDDIWNLVVQEINNKQKLVFSNDSVEELEDFQLEKSFDDSSGALETNAKDNIPNIVKTAIKRTPIVLSFNEDGTPNYDKNNFLGLPKFMDFDIYYPYLQDKLANIEDHNDLINRLNNIAELIPSFKLLIDTIQEDENLLSGWTSHFDKQKVDFIKEVINVNNVIIGHNSIKSTVNTPSDILANKWKQTIENNLIEDKYNKASIRGLGLNLKSKFKDFDSNKEDIIDTITSLYNQVGITYKDINIPFIIEKEITNKDNLAKYKTPANIIDKLFIKKFQYLLDDINAGKFNSYGNLISIANTLEKYTVIPLQNSFLSITGKPKYAITLPNFLSKFFKKFNNKNTNSIKDMIELYRKVPSMKYSNWLSQMYEQDENGDIILNTEFINNFSYTISDGIKETNSYLGTDYKSLTDIDWDLLNIIKFNKLKTSSTKTFYETSILIPADSSNIYNLKVPYYSTLFGKNMTKGASYKAVKNIIYQEIQAIKQAKDFLFDVDKIGNIIKVKDSVDQTKLQNNYHYKLDKNNNKVFIDNNGNPVGNVFKFHTVESLNNTELLYKGGINEALSTQEINDIINNTTAKYIHEEIFTPAINNFSNLKPSLYHLIFDEVYNTGSKDERAAKDKKWNRYIANYAINEFIANAEMYNFFYGNISEYSNKIDIGKRLKEVVAPGLAQSSIGKPTFNVITLNDVILDSDNVVYLAEYIAESIKSTKNYTTSESSFNIDRAINSPVSLLEQDVNKFLNQYKNINTTDAQGYITLDRFKEILLKEGRLDSAMISLIDKVKEGEKLNIDELSVFLEPVKGFYYNRYYDEYLNKLVSKQIKYSTFPLIPQFTKGLELDVLRIHMEKNKVDEAVYTSTTKVGLRDSTTIADDKGNIIPSALSNLSVETLNNTYWQRQLDVPDDVLDKEKLLGVQIARIVFGNELDNSDFELYSEILATNLYSSQLKVIDDLGVKINEEGEIQEFNYDKVRSLIDSAIKDQNLNKALAESIQPKSITNRNFRLPLFSSSLTKKFQSIFLSKFTNDITNQKLPGFSAVQFSSSFIKRKSDKSVGEFTLNYITDKDPTEPLQVKYENGKIIMEVLAPIYDSTFIENGNIIDINSLSEDARTIVGYRIPSDALHNTVVFKVVGLLPREMSSSMIVPKEVVVQMGSDFDVDKLYVFRKHLNKPKNEKYLIDTIKYDNEKEASSQSIEARQNRIIDIFIDKISNPANSSEMLKPSSFEKMEEIQKLVEDTDNSINVFTYTGQKELRKRNLSGQALTGIAANFNTFVLLAQKGNFIISNPIKAEYKKEDVDVSYLRKNYTILNETETTIIVRHNKLAKNNTGFLNANKDLISELIGETLATAVDTVKKPILPSFNISSFTYPIFGTGILTGIDHKTYGLFIAQPIIVDLNNTYFQSQSDILSSKDYYINQIRNRYIENILKLDNKTLSQYKKFKTQDERNNYLGFKAESPILSLYKLQNNLQKQDRNVEELKEYYAEQLNYLDLFIEQKQISDEANKLISASKVDNKKVGPTISVVQQLMDNINSLNPTIQFDEEIRDTALIKQNGNVNAIKVIYPEQFGIESKSIYPPLQDYLSRSSLFAAELSKELFIQNTDSFSLIVQDIIKTSRLPYNTSNIEKVNTFLISSLSARSETLLNTNYEQILGIDKDLESVGKKLYAVKNNPAYKNLIEDNTNILFYLEPKLGKNLDTIQFKSVRDSLLESLLYDSFEDLYKSNDPILSDLAIDLFKYSFITNGLSFGISSFSSLLPISMYEDLGIVKELDDAHRQALGGSSFTIQQFSKDIYFRNMWNDSKIIPIVPSKKLTEVSNTGILKFKNINRVSNSLLNANYIRRKQYRKATKDELKQNPNNKVVLKSDNIYQLLAIQRNEAGQIRNIFFYPVPKLGNKYYIDFYDNINNKSKKDLYKDLPYSNFDEALDVLEEIEGDSILGYPDEEVSHDEVSDNEEETEEKEIKDIDSKTLDKLTSFIETRILNIERQIQRFNNKEFTKVSKNFIDTLNGLDTANQIVELSKHISRRIKGVNVKLDIVEETKEPTLDNLKKLRNSFTVINSFKDLLNLNFIDIKKEIKQKNQEELYKALEQLESTIKPLIELTPRAKELSEILIRKKVEPLSSNPEVINQTVDILGLQKDENQVQGFLDALADTNNILVSLIVKDLNTALDKRNLEVQRKTKEFSEKYKEFESQGYTFNDLLMRDKEGNVLPNLITEFDYIAFQNSKEAMYAEVKKMHIDQEGLDPESKAFKIIESKIERTKAKWYSTNQRVIPNVKEVLNKKKSELTEEEYYDWYEANTVQGTRDTYYTGELVQPNPSIYGVKEYQILTNSKTPRAEKRLEFYNYYRSLMKELVQDNSKTFIDNGDIPAVPVDNRTWWEAVKQDVLQIRNNRDKSDDRTKLINVDESGNITSILVQPYLKRTFSYELKDENDESISKSERKRRIEENLEVKRKHQRLNIDSVNLNMSEVIPEFIKTSIDFNTRKSFEDEILLAKEIINSSQVETRKGTYDRIATKLTGEQKAVIINGAESNIKKHLDKYIKMVFYDDFEEQENENLVRISSLLQNYTSLVQIGFNPFVGINNKVYGTLQNVIESSGGYFFDRDSYKKGRKFYNNGDSLLAYFSGRHQKESSTLQEGLIKTFSIYQSQRELSGKKGNPITGALDKYKYVNDAIYGMQTLGEHTMQNVSLFSMMHSHRIVDGKARTYKDFIDSKIEKITDKNQNRAKEILERNKNIKENLKQEFEKLPRVVDVYELTDGYVRVKDQFNFSDEAFSEFRQRVIGVNQYMHGIYVKEDAGTLQAYALGRLALQMKKWLRPGWNRRFGTHFGGNFWNERRQAPDEGMYVSTYNFVKDIIKGQNDFAINYKIVWNNMNEFQKSNVRKTLVELSALFSFYLITAMAKSLSEDDEDLRESRIFNMFMYQSDRVWKELALYTPFGLAAEGQKLLKSPMASYGTVKNLYQLSYNMMLYPFRDEKDRTYQGGMRHGQDKVYSKLVDTLPVINKAERLYNIRRNNEFYSLL